MNSASLCSLAGRYDNPIPPRFLAPIDYLKIPAQVTGRMHVLSVLTHAYLPPSLPPPPHWWGGVGGGEGMVSGFRQSQKQLRGGRGQDVG